MKHFTRNTLPIDRPLGHYVKKVPTLAIRIDGPFEVETREGTLTCQDGWLALDSNGEPYPIAADIFDATYKKAE